MEKLVMFPVDAWMDTINQWDIAQPAPIAVWFPLHIPLDVLRFQIIHTVLHAANAMMAITTLDVCGTRILPQRLVSNAMHPAQLGIIYKGVPSTTQAIAHLALEIVPVATTPKGVRTGPMGSALRVRLEVGTHLGILQVPPVASIAPRGMPRLPREIHAPSAIQGVTSLETLPLFVCLVQWEHFQLGMVALFVHHVLQEHLQIQLAFQHAAIVPPAAHLEPLWQSAISPKTEHVLVTVGMWEME